MLECLQGWSIQLMWFQMKDVHRHIITIFIRWVKVLRTRLLIDILCILMHLLLVILLSSLMKNSLSCYRHNFFNGSPSIRRWLGHWHHWTCRQHINWLQKKFVIETASFCLLSDIPNHGGVASFGYMWFLVRSTLLLGLYWFP